jgi:O-antigen/teichoic acid export membrane protein
VLTPVAAHAFATGGVQELRRVLILAGTFVAITMGTFSLLFLVAGDWIIVLAFGEHFRGTGVILDALAFSALSNGLSIVAGNGLWAIDQPRSNFVADVCSMVVTLVAAAILIPPFAALGAALATLAGTTVAAIMRIFILVRRLDADVLDAAISEITAIPS